MTISHLDGNNTFNIGLYYKEKDSNSNGFLGSIFEKAGKKDLIQMNVDICNGAVEIEDFEEWL